MLFGWLVVWLLRYWGCLVGRSVGRSVVWLVGWSVGWLVGWLCVCLIDCFCVFVRLNGCLFDWCLFVWFILFRFLLFVCLSATGGVPLTRRVAGFQHFHSKRRDYEMVASRLKAWPRLKAWRRLFHSLCTVETNVLGMLQAFPRFPRSSAFKEKMFLVCYRLF